MKKVLLLLVVLFALFVVLNRERLFLRDPLASVIVDDVVQDNTRVYINFSNEVLVEHTVDPISLVIVERNQHIGLPMQLRCMRWTGCLVDADPATLVQTMKGPVGTMDAKMVQYKDDAGKSVTVKLR
jgi:hypothetical protein